jgi:hypothetical protein
LSIEFKPTGVLESDAATWKQYVLNSLKQNLLGRDVIAKTNSYLEYDPSDKDLAKSVSDRFCSASKGAANANSWGAAAVLAKQADLLVSSTETQRILSAALDGMTSWNHAQNDNAELRLKNAQSPSKTLWKPQGGEIYQGYSSLGTPETKEFSITDVGIQSIWSNGPFLQLFSSNPHHLTIEDPGPGLNDLKVPFIVINSLPQHRILFVNREQRDQFVRIYNQASENWIHTVHIGTTICELSPDGMSFSYKIHATNMA